MRTDAGSAYARRDRQEGDERAQPESRSVATLAVVGVLVAACGGQETLTHDELVTKANEVCSERVAEAQMIVGRRPPL